MPHTEELTSIARKMGDANLPQLAIDTFAVYYQQLRAGATGLIPEAEIVPVDSLPDVEQLSTDYAPTGHRVLPHTIVIKLNGGLGTGMGLDSAKSLLPVKNGFSFLDITAHQVQLSNNRLLLMNSFATRTASLARLAQYPKLPAGETPLDFVQHKVPKIDQKSYLPIEWPANPAFEWCPPGHGDLYVALITSGMLEQLLATGYRYAFVSNSDNLGAVMDETILGYFVAQGLPFMMEVADRTLADRKGGHLGRRQNGQLILRESAQCPVDDMSHFQDIARHRYFNTNNLWLNLEALRQTMATRKNILGLPMIRNRKTVDPRDPSSPPVYQLETAMGAAIGVFENSAALRVPRTRFAPVKTTNDLLVVRSDAYVLTEQFRVVKTPNRTLGTLVIDLDPIYYKLLPDFEARFPHGCPSLIDCESLTVRGDIRFGANVVIRGNVILTNTSAIQVVIPDSAVIEQDVAWG